MSKQPDKKIINITCTLLESKDHSRILFDISGNKDKFYRNMIQTLIDKIKTDKMKHIAIVKELDHLLKQHNFSAEIIESVSANTRNTIFIDPPFCSEKSTHPEIEKNIQLLNRDQEMKVSVAHFILVVLKIGNFWSINGLYPQGSCNSCLQDKKAGFYAARNSWIGEDGIVDCEIKRKKLGSIGNIGFAPLSPRRSLPLLPTILPVDDCTSIKLTTDHMVKDVEVSKLTSETKVTTKQHQDDEEKNKPAKKSPLSVGNALGVLVKSVPNFTKFFPKNPQPVVVENEKSIVVESKINKSLPKTMSESMGNLVKVLKCNKNEIASWY